MNARHATERKKKENEDRQRKVRLIGRQNLIHAGNWEWNLVTKKYIWCNGCTGFSICHYNNLPQGLALFLIVFTTTIGKGL